MQLKSGELVTIFDNVTNLIEKDIPDQGIKLSDNVTNLEKVAQYCEDIYVNSKEANKTYLLDETKGYTAQALASVAYQINMLANSFISLLDSQSSLIDDMSNSMSNLAHEVSIHKEKVARREIGVLTTNKSVVRTAKFKRPDIEEKPVKYIRKPIDYSMLDDVGHGVKINRQSANLEPLTKIGVNRQNSYSSTHSSNGIQSANPVVQQASENVATPPPHLKVINNGTVRSINSGKGQYIRTPVAPPSVPSEYMTRQELGIYSSKKELNQSAGADSLSAAGGYGGPPGGYKQRPSINNLGMNISSAYNNNSVNEYSGTDTIDRRMAQNYIQQLSLQPGLNNSLNMNNNSTVNYASGKDMNIIRTNLNNIDYTTTGTIYRRPQLHPGIYERTNLQTGQDMNGHQQAVNPSVNHNTSKNSNNQNNSSLLSNRSSGSVTQGLPPPPPPMFNFEKPFPPHPINFNSNTIDADHIENQIFDGMDYIDRVLNLEVDNMDDDGIIPNWVPIERCLEKVITTYDYEGLRDDELSFKENMFIYVIKKNDDHWYEGIMKTESGNIVQGLYPYNYARCVRKFVEDSRVTQC